MSSGKSGIGSECSDSGRKDQQSGCTTVTSRLVDHAGVSYCVDHPNIGIGDEAGKRHRMAEHSGAHGTNRKPADEAGSQGAPPASPESERAPPPFSRSAKAFGELSAALRDDF